MPNYASKEKYYASFTYERKRKVIFFQTIFLFYFSIPKEKRHYSQNVNRKPKPNKNTVVSYNNVVIKIRVGYPPNQGNG